MEVQEFLGKKEFALSQGWSPSYVTKLLKQNRIVLSDDEKRVNVQATLALLGRTADPGKEGVRQHHAETRLERAVVADDPPPAAATTSADPQYWQAKARREAALAELAEMDLAKKRGDLVDRNRVERAGYGVARLLRDAIMGLPARVAPQLAAESDPFEVERLMRAALRSALDDATRLTADDLASAFVEH